MNYFFSLFLLISSVFSSKIMACLSDEIKLKSSLEMSQELSELDPTNFRKLRKTVLKDLLLQNNKTLTIKDFFTIYHTSLDKYRNNESTILQPSDKTEGMEGFSSDGEIDYDLYFALYGGELLSTIASNYNKKHETAYLDFLQEFAKDLGTVTLPKKEELIKSLDHSVRILDTDDEETKKIKENLRTSFLPKLFTHLSELAESEISLEDLVSHYYNTLKKLNLKYMQDILTAKTLFLFMEAL
jgi:hypothetical protein